MALTLNPSPMHMVDPSRPAAKRVTVLVTYTDEKGREVPFAAAFGADEHEARLRAEVICAAVNRMPTPQEFPT